MVANVMLRALLSRMQLCGSDSNDRDEFEGCRDGGSGDENVCGMSSWWSFSFCFFQGKKGWRDGRGQGV